MDKLKKTACDCGGKYKIKNIKHHKKTHIHQLYERIRIEWGLKSQIDPITKNYITIYERDEKGNIIWNNNLKKN